MKVNIEEDIKSLYEGYTVKDSDNLLFDIVGKKKIDDILEVYNREKQLLISVKKITYFGTINFEIYKDDILLETVGEEINSFKDIYYFDTLGFKLEFNEEKSEYIVTDIEDKIIFTVKSFETYENRHFEIDLQDEDRLLESVIISIIMYIYYKTKSI